MANTNIVARHTCDSLASNEYVVHTLRCTWTDRYDGIASYVDVAIPIVHLSWKKVVFMSNIPFPKQDKGVITAYL